MEGQSLKQLWTGLPWHSLEGDGPHQQAQITL